MRVHLALNVSDLEAAVAYYTKLLGAPPSKRKPGYANFALETPPLKLALFEAPGASERLNHVGVETPTFAEVEEAIGRLSAEGIARDVARDTTCCYAKKAEVWSADPQGLRWEWYNVRGDSETFGPEEPPSVEAASPARS